MPHGGPMFDVLRLTRFAFAILAEQHATGSLIGRDCDDGVAHKSTNKVRIGTLTTARMKAR